MTITPRLRLLPGPDHPSPHPPLDVARLRRLHAAATEGGVEWEADVLLAEGLGSTVDGVAWLEADVRLVAAAVNALPALLDAYEAREGSARGRAGGGV